MTLIDFTQPKARRFYSSMGNPLAVKGLSGLFLAVPTSKDNRGATVIKLILVTYNFTRNEQTTIDSLESISIGNLS